MKSFVSWLLCFLLVSQQAVACLNDHAATKLDGSWQSSEDGDYTTPRPLAGHNLAAEAPANRRRLRTLDSLWRARHWLADYAGYGLVLTRLGRYAEAGAVFRQLETWQPDQYATASNLGTVYELLGQNELALHWIEKAIRLNPRSHRGTEWLHANILRAKMQGAPAINSRFLLGVDFGSAATPVPVLQPGVVLDSVQQALYYQLSERLSFVYPTDPIMAELLFDLGNAYALTSNVEAALPVYAQAQQFGYHGRLLLKRRTYFWWLRSGESTVVTALFFGAVGLFGFGLWRLGRAAVRRFA
jgi:tetratricopeptide (TPR) repeat protein